MATAQTHSELGRLSALLPSWRIHLEAANRSQRTIQNYIDAGQQLAAFLADRGMPTQVDGIHREHVEAFIADLLERLTSSTAATRYRALQQLFKWLLEEGEIESNPMARMKPPKLDEKPVPVIPDADLKKLFAACAGQEFVDKRDIALFRLMLGSGLRLGEIAGLELDDVNFKLREVRVTGKGNKVRDVPMGPKTVKALDRYVRARPRHPDSDSPALWLGSKGRLTDSGITQILRRRCREAGIEQLHPHQFRHSFAHQWLSQGGSEHDLAKLAGWNSLQMVGRYASSAAVERAKDAYRRVLPGETV